MNPLLDRRFMIMVLLSLLLHSLLLALINPPWRKAMAELPPLIATLRLVQAGSAPAASPHVEAPRPASPRPAAPPPQAQPSAIPPLPPLSAQETPAGPTISAAAFATTPASTTAAGPLPPAAAALPATTANAGSGASAAAAVTNTAPPGPGASRSPGEAAEALAAYRRQLGALFAGQQDYPRLAALRGWEGEVRLRLKVARKGTLLDISLDHSSGFELLDRSAQALVEALPALPPLPDSIDLNEIQVVVPIHYKLRKTT